MADQDRDDEIEDDVIGREEEGDELEGDDELDDDVEGADDEPTGEIGSEGGSPGDSVGVTRSRVGSTRGSEATETWSPDQDDTTATPRTDDTDRSRRRTP